MFRLAFLAASLALVLVTTPARAFVPDPSRSFCQFPAQLPCPDPVTVTVILLDAFDAPVPACATELQLLVDAGTLEPGQTTAVSGATNAVGAVTLTFPDGIKGSGVIHFRVHATCVGDIQICTSPQYPLVCTSVPVDPTGWGRTKSQYR